MKTLNYLNSFVDIPPEYRYLFNICSRWISVEDFTFQIGETIYVMPKMVEIFFQCPWI